MLNLIQYLSCLIVFYGFLEMNMQQFFGACSLALRYIPNEELGDAASIEFRLSGCF
jgi:hypothetical protein